LEENDESKDENSRTYLKIGFLSSFVIPGLTRNPVTLPFYYIKTEHYELPMQNTKVAGYRLSPV
jgi:hypothetical protein